MRYVIYGRPLKAYKLQLVIQAIILIIALTNSSEFRHAKDVTLNYEFELT
jgi:predicted anti-sigma-YlaC factor YlaD